MDEELAKEWLYYIRAVCIDGSFGAYDDDWEHMLEMCPKHPMVQLVEVLIRHGYRPLWSGPDA